MKSDTTKLILALGLFAFAVGCGIAVLVYG